jgi:hypothetical protein
VALFLLWLNIETLLGTDPRKADNGTSDGAEVTAGRNPLIKGPNDKASAAGITATSTKNMTATDRAARDFFARYMQLNQAGLADSADDQAALIQEVVQNNMILSKPKTFLLKDIQISSNDSKDAIRAYGNAVGLLFKKYNDPASRNELVITKESIETNNPGMLAEIDPIIASYKNILQGLLKTAVPPSLSMNHVLMINSFNTLLFSATSLRKSENDSLAGVEGASVWLQAANDLNTAFNTMKTSFSLNGIVYDSTEPGSFFIPLK